MGTQELLLTFIYNIQNVNYSYHVVHYIPSTYLSYNWKLVCFDHLPPIPPPPMALPLLVTTNLISLSTSLFVFEA